MIQSMTSITRSSACSRSGREAVHERYRTADRHPRAHHLLGQIVRPTAVSARSGRRASPQLQIVWCRSSRASVSSLIICLHACACVPKVYQYHTGLGSVCWLSTLRRIGETLEARTTVSSRRGRCCAAGGALMCTTKAAPAAQFLVPSGGREALKSRDGQARFGGD